MEDRIGSRCDAFQPYLDLIEFPWGQPGELRQWGSSRRGVDKGEADKKTENSGKLVRKRELICTCLLSEENVLSVRLRRV